MPKIERVSRAKDGESKVFVALGKDTIGIQWSGCDLTALGAEQDLDSAARVRDRMIDRATIRVYEITED